MAEELKVLGKIVKVESVARKKKKVISVRMQYIYLVENDGEHEKILHDVEFVPNGRGWVKISRRIIDNYIPPKRYIKMSKKAAAIIYDKKIKKAEQLYLPFQQ